MSLSAWYRRGSLALLLSASLAGRGQAAPPEESLPDLNRIFAQAEPAVLPSAPTEPIDVAPSDGTAGVAQVPAATPPAGSYDAPTPPPPPAPAPAAKPPAPPPQPWKLLFFDNDFSYKTKPNAPHFLGEELKDIPLDFLPCESWISTGGELRYRYMDEANRFRVGGPGRSQFNLWRWRHYVDFHYTDAFRVYVEMIDASMFGLDAPYTPQGIDINRWDIQNLFFDLKVFEFDDKPVFFRYGRQELLYGSQRLVSPLDWANTRRNFEGAKLFRKGEAWDLDAWLTRPVNTATPNDGPLAQFQNHFDSPNQQRIFGGVWGTYKAVKNNTVDLYWLWDHSDQAVVGFPLGNRHTLGGRWLSNMPVLDCCGNPYRTYHAEFEGGYQVGDDRGQDVQAGFFVAGLGHTWNQLPWEPNLWVFYDWASGDRNATDGTNNTFFQHVGLVHAYLGLIDNIARQNISDINFRFTVKPTKQLNCQAAMHWFDLASQSDTLYTITGAKLGTPGTGGRVGQELDLLATYTFSPNFNIQSGYFWFWNDDYIKINAPRGNGQMFYLQTTFSY